MVVPVVGVPALASQVDLPLGENPLEVAQVETLVVPLAQGRVGVGVHAHVLELEEGLELASIKAGVKQAVGGGDAGSLAHCNDGVVREHLTVHFCQVLVHAGAVGCHGDGVSATPGCHLGIIGVGRVFGDQVDDVHAEPVDALIEPEAHEVVDLVAHDRVFPVEIGLLG